MSDIKRYEWTRNGMRVYAQPMGRYIQSSDYDAAQSELAALREELASANNRLRDVATLCATVEQRLTSAEQRNADVEKRAADLVECLWGLELPGAGNPRLRKLMRALAQPTESGASE